MLKIWLFLEYWHSNLPQQFTFHVEAKTNLTDDRKQQSCILETINMTLDPTNALNSTPSIY